MSVITQNATAISVICTVGFGLVYVSCAIWNAYSNHRRNKISQSSITADILSKLPPELKEQVELHIRENKMQMCSDWLSSRYKIIKEKAEELAEKLRHLPEDETDELDFND